MFSRGGVVYYIMIVIGRTLATQTYFSMARCDTPWRLESQGVITEREIVKTKDKMKGGCWACSVQWWGEHGYNCARTGTGKIWYCAWRLFNIRPLSVNTSVCLPSLPFSHSSTYHLSLHYSSGKWLLLFSLTPPLYPSSSLPAFPAPML